MLELLKLSNTDLPTSFFLVEILVKWGMRLAVGRLRRFEGRQHILGCLGSFGYPVGSNKTQAFEE